MPEQTLYQQPGQQLSLSFVKPDFINEDLLEQPQPIFRYDDRGSRYYATFDDSGKVSWYGSVTTIKDAIFGTAKPIIEKRISMGDDHFFRYVQNRQDYGLLLHQITSDIIKDGKFDFGPRGEGLKERIDLYTDQHDVEYTDARYGKLPWFKELWLNLMSWVQFINDYDVKPIATEISLADPSGFACTIDHWVDMYKQKYTEKTPEKNRKRVEAIIDVKSGYIFPDHAIQMQFNKRAVRSNYGDKANNIKRLYNWTGKEWYKYPPSYSLVNQTNKVKDSHLDKYIWMWKNDFRVKYDRKPRDVKIPTGQITVGNDLSNNYREVPIDEFITEIHSEL